jgi:O-antigen/teichoic acid export membrane protein
VNRRLELVRFSFPIALQESSFSLCNWLAILLLTKYSSVGEVGLYTASAQWNAIITIIPGLLVNVILAHLAGSMSDRTVHKRTLHTMLGVNFLCTLLPFAVVYVLASYISSFYGPDFVGMPPVLRVLTFVAIFDCCSQVFRSEFIAQGRPWTVFLIRLSRDVLLVMLVLLLLQHSGGEHGAVRYATALVVASAFHFVMLLLVYWWKSSFLVHKES